MVKKYLCYLAITLALLMLPVPSGAETIPEVEANIANINQYGSITLSIGAQSMRELGYEPADIILVKIEKFRDGDADRNELYRC